LVAAAAFCCAAQTLQVQDSQQRQNVAENQRQEAKSQNRTPARVNDANQAAICV
jgi:twitching motility protein PilJ